MLDVVTMNFTRRRVLRGIRELSREGNRVLYEQLADYADCSTKTVSRAVAELEAEGKIIREGGQRHGYKFELVNAKTN